MAFREDITDKFPMLKIFRAVNWEFWSIRLASSGHDIVEAAVEDCTRIRGVFDWDDGIVEGFEGVGEGNEEEKEEAGEEDKVFLLHGVN